MSSSVVFTHIQRVRLLYKTILKLHRGLPLEAKAIGDQYVMDEFRRHKKCQPAEADVFMKEWADYAIMLAKQLGVRRFDPKNLVIGRQLAEEELNNFRDEQIAQLYKLMQEARKPKEGPDEVYS